MGAIAAKADKSLLASDQTHDVSGRADFDYENSDGPESARN